MTQLEEQLSKFYPEAIPIEREEVRRFSVGWWSIQNNQEIVIVFDKLEHKIVYKGRSRTRKDHYDYLKSFYGIKNCDPPREVNPQLYEGL